MLKALQPPTGHIALADVTTPLDVTPLAHNEEKAEDEHSESEESSDGLRIPKGAA